MEEMEVAVKALNKDKAARIDNIQVEIQIMWISDKNANKNPWQDISIR